MLELVILVHSVSRLHNVTEDPVKSIETIAHSVRLQGSALASYRLRAEHGWQGNQSFGV
jgi:hypothetical protein